MAVYAQQGRLRLDYMEIDMDRQLFVLDKDIWKSLDYDIVVSTLEDMGKANVLPIPHQEFDIQTTPYMIDFYKYGQPDHKKLEIDLTQLEGVYHTLCFRYVYEEDLSNTDQVPSVLVKIDKQFYPITQAASAYGNTYDEAKSLAFAYQKSSMQMLSTLLVLLATKNASKETEQIKRHGPQSKKRPRDYKYVTTIKIGKITDTLRSNGVTGSTVRPHLRRGHIRNQRFGEGYKESRPIFIHPMFVNADDGWIENQRKEYRVKV